MARQVTLKCNAGTAKAIVTSETDHLQAAWRRGGFYEAGMLDYIHNHYSGGTFIDCGSAIGNHTLYFSKFCNCDVVSIDPIIQSLNIQRDVLRLNSISNVIRIQAALGHCSGIGRMEKIQIKNQAAWNMGMWTLVRDNSGNIPIMTLDSIVSKLRIENVTLIKIDVEFSELNVLLGAKEVIQAHSPVVFVECPSDKSLDDVIGYFAEFGYVAGKRFNASPTYEFKKVST